MDTKHKDNGDTPDRDKPPREISPWEWGIAVLGALLVIASVSIIVYEAFSSTGRPPDLIVRVEGVAAVEGGYLATIRVRNNGGQTAADVIVEGAMNREGDTVERSYVTIDYVPAHSRRSGGLFFTRDPRVYPVTLRALGYATP